LERLVDRDGVVVRVVPTGELLRQRIGILLPHTLDEEIAYDLLHVPNRLLGHIR
jgi:hypothetical protein